MRATYDLFMPLLFEFEGGYTDDPQDPGGATNWGITIYDARKYWKPNATPADVRAMPKGVAAEIYRSKYAPAVAYDAMPAGTDCVVMDGGVNSGPSRGLRWLQQALGSEKTMALQLAYDAARVTDQTALIKRQCANRRAFLQSLRTFSHFGPGWMNRVARLEAFAVRMWLQVGAEKKPEDQTNTLNKESEEAKKKQNQSGGAAGGGAAGGGGASQTAPPHPKGWWEWFLSLPWWQEVLLVAALAALILFIVLCIHRAYQHKLRADAYAREAKAVAHG